MQVALMHITAHFKTPLPEKLAIFIDWFAGVPIFFSISGFLIAMSFDRNNSIKRYLWNRFLRIYPALWMCFLFSVFLLFIFGFLTKEWTNINLYLWSIFQFSGYTVGMHVLEKSIFANYGVGEVNGSLWTIPIEIQFYFILPFLLYTKIKNARYSIVFLACGASLFVYNKVIYLWAIREVSPQLLMLYFSVLPHLFSFLLGTLFYLNFESLKRYIDGKFHIWFLLYVFIRIVYRYFGVVEYYPMEQNIGLLLIYRIALVFMIMSFAFSFRSLSKKLLKGNDISYGFYIYHMLVVNAFVYLGYYGDYRYTVLAFLISIILGLCSWLFVEKQMLKLKYRSLFVSNRDNNQGCL